MPDNPKVTVSIGAVDDLSPVLQKLIQQLNAVSQAATQTTQAIQGISTKFGPPSQEFQKLNPEIVQQYGVRLGEAAATTGQIARVNKIITEEYNKQGGLVGALQKLGEQQLKSIERAPWKERKDLTTEEATAIEVAAGKREKEAAAAKELGVAMRVARMESEEMNLVLEQTNQRIKEASQLKEKEIAYQNRLNAAQEAGNKAMQENMANLQKGGMGGGGGGGVGDFLMKARSGQMAGGGFMGRLIQDLVWGIESFARYQIVWRLAEAGINAVGAAIQRLIGDFRSFAQINERVSSGAGFWSNILGSVAQGKILPGLKESAAAWTDTFNAANLAGKSMTDMIGLQQQWQAVGFSPKQALQMSTAIHQMLGESADDVEKVAISAQHFKATASDIIKIALEKPKTPFGELLAPALKLQQREDIKPYLAMQLEDEQHEAESAFNMRRTWYEREFQQRIIGLQRLQQHETLGVDRQIQDAQRLIEKQHIAEDRAFEDRIRYINREMEERHLMIQRSTEEEHLASQREMEDRFRAINREMEQRHRLAAQAAEDEDRYHNRRIGLLSGIQGAAQAAYFNQPLRGPGGQIIPGMSQALSELRAEMKVGMEQMTKDTGLSVGTIKTLIGAGMMSPTTLLEEAQVARREQRIKEERAREEEARKQRYAEEDEQREKERAFQDKIRQMRIAMEDEIRAKRYEIEDAVTAKQRARQNQEIAFQDAVINIRRQLEDKQIEIAEKVQDAQIEFAKSLADYERDLQLRNYRERLDFERSFVMDAFKLNVAMIQATAEFYRQTVKMMGGMPGTPYGPQGAGTTGAPVAGEGGAVEGAIGGVVEDLNKSAADAVKGLDNVTKSITDQGKATQDSIKSTDDLSDREKQLKDSLEKYRKTIEDAQQEYIDLIESLKKLVPKPEGGKPETGKPTPGVAGGPYQGTAPSGGGGGRGGGQAPTSEQLFQFSRQPHVGGELTPWSTPADVLNKKLSDWARQPHVGGEQNPWDPGGFAYKAMRAGGGGGRGGGGAGGTISGELQGEEYRHFSESFGKIYGPGGRGTMTDVSGGISVPESSVSSLLGKPSVEGKPAVSGEAKGNLATETTLAKIGELLNQVLRVG